MRRGGPSGHHRPVDIPDDTWITVLGYENLPGRLSPQAALRA